MSDLTLFVDKHPDFSVFLVFMAAITIGNVADSIAKAFRNRRGGKKE